MMSDLHRLLDEQRRELPKELAVCSPRKYLENGTRAMRPPNTARSVTSPRAPQDPDLERVPTAASARPGAPSIIQPRLRAADNGRLLLSTADADLKGPAPKDVKVHVPQPPKTAPILSPHRASSERFDLDHPRRPVPSDTALVNAVDAVCAILGTYRDLRVGISAEERSKLQELSRLANFEDLRRIASEDVTEDPEGQTEAPLLVCDRTPEPPTRMPLPLSPLPQLAAREEGPAGLPGAAFVPLTFLRELQLTVDRVTSRLQVDDALGDLQAVIRSYIPEVYSVHLWQARGRKLVRIDRKIVFCIHLERSGSARVDSAGRREAEPRETAPLSDAAIEVRDAFTSNHRLSTDSHLVLPLVTGVGAPWGCLEVIPLRGQSLTTLPEDLVWLLLAAAPFYRHLMRVYELDSRYEKRVTAMETVARVANSLSHTEMDERVLVWDLMECARTVCEAERASLFVPSGGDADRWTELVAQSRSGRRVVVPRGKGIVGHVADSGACVNITDVQDCNLFFDTVDSTSGFVTRSVLCAPVFHEGALVGVAQLINKTDTASGRSAAFTHDDEEHFENLITVIALCLHSKRRKSELTGERTKMSAVFEAVLKLAASDLTDSATIKQAVLRVSAELAPSYDTVYLLPVDQERSRLIVDPTLVRTRMSAHQNENALHKPDVAAAALEPEGLAGAAYMSQKPQRYRFQRGELTDTSGSGVYCPRIDAVGLAATEMDEILCIPLVFGKDTIAVLQLVAFSVPHATSAEERHQTDVNMSELTADIYQSGGPHAPAPFQASLLAAFGVFAAIWLHNADLIDFMIRASKAATRLSTNFRASRGASTDGVPKTSLTKVDSAALSELRKFELDDTVRATITLPTFDLWTIRERTDSAPQLIASRVVLELFLSTGLPQQLGCREETLAGFIVACRAKYRHVPYHSFFHAVDVTQTIFHFLYSGGAVLKLTPVETFVLLIAGMAHDLDHMGVNNSFYIKTDSPMGILSTAGGSQSVLEVHHCNMAIDILANPSANVFEGLEKDDEVAAYRLLMELILGTDMAKHGETVAALKAMPPDALERDRPEHRRIAASTLLKAADISNVTKPFPISRRWGQAVVEEFSLQGDREKRHGITDVLPMFDREKNADLAKGQIGFIQFVARPFFELVVSRCFPRMQYALDGLNQNIAQWEQTAAAAAASAP